MTPLEQWTQRLSQNEMPVLARTAQEVSNAAEVAHAYGAPGIGRLIPTAGPQIEAEEEPIEEAIHPEDFLQPDPMLQLHILRDIAAQLTSDKPDINLLFSMALEGIHRGIGMDRTVLALLAPDRKSIRAKYTLGWGQNELMQSFHFTAFQERDLFSEVMETRQPLWFRNEKDEADHITSHVRSVLGETPFFIAPLVAQGRAIGLIYSDRRGCPGRARTRNGRPDARRRGTARTGGFARGNPLGSNGF